MSWYTDSGQPGEGFLREAKITSCTGIETPAAKFFVIFGSVKNTYTEIKGKEQVQHYPFHYIMHLKWEICYNNMTTTVLQPFVQEYPGEPVPEL